jgi:tRNA U55 pseudouridine synthase TruB
MVDLDKIKEAKTTKELLDFGIINIDKPSGPTSFNVSDFIHHFTET